MREILYTQEELSEKWQCSIKTIESYRRQGILKKCEKIPAIRFTAQHIAELEGVKLEKFSPILKNKMQMEIDKLTKENEELREVIRNVVKDVIMHIKI